LLIYYQVSIQGVKTVDLQDDQGEQKADDAAYYSVKTLSFKTLFELSLPHVWVLLDLAATTRPVLHKLGQIAGKEPDGNKKGKPGATEPL
jgi:hypothetical protein